MLFPCAKSNDLEYALKSDVNLTFEYKQPPSGGHSATVTRERVSGRRAAGWLQFLCSFVSVTEVSGNIIPHFYAKVKKIPRPLSKSPDLPSVRFGGQRSRHRRGIKFPCRQNRESSGQAE
jgi:hypothetical protein